MAKPKQRLTNRKKGGKSKGAAKPPPKATKARQSKAATRQPGTPPAVRAVPQALQEHGDDNWDFHIRFDDYIAQPSVHRRFKMLSSLGLRKTALNAAFELQAKVMIAGDGSRGDFEKKYNILKSQYEKLMQAHGGGRPCDFHTRV